MSEIVVSIFIPPPQTVRIATSQSYLMHHEMPDGTARLIPGLWRSIQDGSGELTAAMFYETTGIYGDALRTWEEIEEIGNNLYATPS